ncbi:MAG: hypothetical protein WB511_10400, partial [Nitrososphaeraceae archaeon]
STRGLHRLFEQTETQSMWVPYVENAFELFWNRRASPRWATEIYERTVSNFADKSITTITNENNTF